MAPWVPSLTGCTGLLARIRGFPDNMSPQLCPDLTKSKSAARPKLSYTRPNYILLHYTTLHPAAYYTLQLSPNYPPFLLLASSRSTTHPAPSPAALQPYSPTALQPHNLPVLLFNRNLDSNFFSRISGVSPKCSCNTAQDFCLWTKEKKKKEKNLLTVIVVEEYMEVEVLVDLAVVGEFPLLSSAAACLVN